RAIELRANHFITWELLERSEGCFNFDSRRRGSAGLDMRIENERELLQDWNRTDTGYPWDRCVHELFEQQAAQSPDAAALICGEAVWSYRRLNERANEIAHHLRGLGVQPDSIVALKLQRSPETIAAILGVLKAGAAYAPLSATDPPARLEALLHDLQPVAVLDDAFVGQDCILRPV